MQKQLYSNNGLTTISSVVSPTDTSISVTDGSVFSSPTGTNFELLTINNSGSVEIVKLTARTGNTLTVSRAQEGTTNFTWPPGSSIGGKITKATLNNLFQNQAIDLTDSISINGANVTANTAIAIGSTSSATAVDGVSIGHTAAASNTQALAIGASVTASAPYSIRIGYTGATAGQAGVGIGYNTVASGADSVAISSGASAAGNKGIAIGNGASATNPFTIAIGDTSLSTGSASGYSVAIGSSCSATGSLSTAIGRQATATATNATSYGYSADATASSATAIGPSATASGDSAIAIGDLSSASGTNSIGIGSGTASGTSCICIGGSGAEAGPADYCTMIGDAITNPVTMSHMMTGPSVIHAETGLPDSYLGLVHAGQENYILSNIIDLKQVAADDIITWTIPTGTTFYPNEFGVIVTTANTVTVQPQISFGISGNTVALLAQTPTTKNVAKGRDVFTPISVDGISGDIRASLKVAATATTLSGRFYIKGLLVQD